MLASAHRSVSSLPLSCVLCSRKVSFEEEVVEEETETKTETKLQALKKKKSLTMIYEFMSLPRLNGLA